MNLFFVKIKHHLRRIAAVVSVFGLAWLVLAYFGGYYDISFIDRDKLFGGTSELPTLNSPTEDPPSSSASESDKWSSPSETEQDTSHVPAVPTNVMAVHNTELLSDEVPNLPILSAMTDYVPATSTFDASCMTVGKMELSFRLPAAYSLSSMETEELSYVIRQEYGEYEAEYTTVEKPRPALSLYMGSIIMDNGDGEGMLYLIDGNGTPLCMFDSNLYRPAYARDRDGRPLFISKNDAGQITYYTLSDNGRQFVASDYNDAADTRGLYFDYPADWGLSDNGISRIYYTDGTYSYQTAYGPLTYQSFTNAFAFSEGLACVTSTENRGGMYFINEYGTRTQQTFVSFLSDLNRYSIWNYVMPASRGLESIGFFYFDHGMTRVRYQIIDYYNWVTFGSARVVSDVDLLLRTDGTLFDLPAGYTLKGYSDGMILLEKDGQFGFMDYTGDWIAEPVYAYAAPFISGLAVLKTADGRFGMIDREGNIILPFTYDALSLPSDGLIAAYREEDGWSVLRVMESTSAVTAPSAS